jgi:hypothetical protein
MSSWWKGWRTFEQTFDILSPCRNLNTVNGALSPPPSTCLNSSFTYTMPPLVALTYSKDLDHCFSAKQLCSLPRCCYWWKSSVGSCSLCTLTLFETLPLELNTPHNSHLGSEKPHHSHSLHSSFGFQQSGSTDVSGVWLFIFLFIFLPKNESSQILVNFTDSALHTHTKN